MDTANLVAAEVAGIGNGLDDLDEANDLVVSGGDIDTAAAAAIQQISEYNESGSAYEITDNAAAVISAGDSVIEDGGVTRVEVTGDASAAQGVDLNAYNANVDFDVRGTIDELTAVINLQASTAIASGSVSGSASSRPFITNLDKALSVTVTVVQQMLEKRLISKQY